MNSWLRHPFDPQEPCCVRCGKTMFLREGCDWLEDERLNLCSSCSIKVIEELIKNSELQQALLSSALEAGISFTYDPPKAENNIISPESLAALRQEIRIVKEQRDDLGSKLAHEISRRKTEAEVVKTVWAQHQIQFNEQQSEIERLKQARELSDEDKDSVIAELRAQLRSALEELRIDSR